MKGALRSRHGRVHPYLLWGAVIVHLPLAYQKKSGPKRPRELLTHCFLNGVPRLFNKAHSPPVPGASSKEILGEQDQPDGHKDEGGNGNAPHGVGGPALLVVVEEQGVEPDGYDRQGALPELWAEPLRADPTLSFKTFEKEVQKAKGNKGQGKAQKESGYA